MNYIIRGNIIQDTKEMRRCYCMNTFEFDGRKYKIASIHQKECGNTLISELQPKGDESILDLGCGDGVLTEQLSLAVPKGKVLGIDASIRMIKTAKSIKKEH